ncbi:acyl transferase domain-containing protein [Actinomadura luteofluorescens]|uniref:Acyl transferase domain-containing protein n=1 Tax=Actinomadura luteofluorescens TaxID=46163 RepID=A0A7Y9JJ70_9ACTN|nr:type I polyketide synthase [Actinomadura luteofluorescens]NYD51157.1 acyl transferase domain-containing protein [Actinomadura luteofluorescens]
MTDIAIVGIDCRFPKAPDPGALWELLMRGDEGIVEVPKSRWNADVYYDPDGGLGKTNTRYAGFVDDADAFDHEFFGFSKEEAEVADPQVRLLLQTAWRALEDATIDPRSLAGSGTGVYVGIMGSEWMSLLMTNFTSITGHVGSGNGYAMAANRISYQLDLRGPSMAVDTACSSSLVATEEACHALRAGVCDQALVGSVNMFITPSSSIYFAQAKVASPDGRCKPFSSKADGFGRAEGVAVLVLRRLDDALADGLPVYAVIRGGAVNHGGRSTTVTAPNPHAQQAVMVEAYKRAGVRPQDIAYVETHGTGTLLGDRLEARALGKVHGVPRERPCAIGSVKGNIGHAEGAAGMAGLIKTALALHHRVVPLSRFSDSENPRLKLAANGLRLVKEPMPLPDGEVLAGVSGFGLGGTNAHIVLATAPEAAAKPDTAPSGAARGGVLTVSARDVEGLRGAARRLAEDVAAAPAGRLAQLSWTSNKVKASGPVRLALPASDRTAAVEALLEAAGDDRRLAALSGRAGTRPKTGWVISGVSAWRTGAARWHEGVPAYRRALGAADAALRPLLGWSVRDVLLSGAEPPAAEPVAFAVAYAAGRTLADVGVKPAWTVGEGVGEYAAAVLAGVFGLEDACRLVAAYGASEPAAAADLACRPPSVPLYSARRGGRLDDEALDAAFWTERPGDGPRFDEALRAAVESEPVRLIEVMGERTDGLRLLPGENGGDALAGIIAALYRDGLNPDWDELYEPGERVRHRLTPYAFAATGRFWWNRPLDGGGDLAASVAEPTGPIPAGGHS